MLQKHIKAASITLALCFVAVMFMIVAVTGFIETETASTAAVVVLLIFALAACVTVFVAHEKHD